MSDPEQSVEPSPDPPIKPQEFDVKSSLTSSYTSTAFEALREDFHALLSELWNERPGNTQPLNPDTDAGFQRFVSEYDKLLRVIKKHQENEKKLISKCRELNAEIVSNASKIQTALRLSFADAANITALKTEVERAWKQVDLANEKEGQARTIIEGLQHQINVLESQLAEQTLTNQQTATLKAELELQHAELIKQREELNNQSSNQVAKIDELNIAVRSSDSERVKKEKEILSLKEKFAAQKTEVQRHARKCERLAGEIASLKEAHEKKMTAAAEREKELLDTRSKRDEFAHELSLSAAANTVLQQENAELRSRHEEDEKLIYLYKQKEADLYGQRDQLSLEARGLIGQLKQREHDLAALTKKCATIEKEKAQLGAARAESDRYKAWLAEEMRTVLKHMNRFKEEAETDERLIKDLQQQIKKLQTSLQQTQERSIAQSQLASSSEALRKQLEQDLATSKQIEHDLRVAAFGLEKEKEREAVKCQAWYTKTRAAEESSKLKDMEIHELQKQLKEEKAKLRLQQTLYEQVRNDRNLFSRAQINSEDEINEMRRKFKIMVHQIEQLKEEIGTKDAALINEHFVLKRLTEELKLAKRKLSKRGELMQRGDDIMAAQQLEIRNLRKVLAACQSSQAVQQRQFEALLTERDVIGCQLIRRNDELALLYEKVRVQSSVLAKGEAQYKERVKDVADAHKELGEVQRRLAIKIEESRAVEAMKVEIRSLEHSLMCERSKVKALSEELENPINVHRWRKLEGSDPHRFDLLHKVQTLQKRLIAQTEATVEAQHSAKQAQSLYASCKAALARAPGPEVHELLSKYERSDRDKNKQMRALCAELNAVTVKCETLQWDAIKHEQEKQELKKRILELTRGKQSNNQSQNQSQNQSHHHSNKQEERKEQTTELSQTLKANDPLAAHAEKWIGTGIRMTGGGFKIDS